MLSYAFVVTNHRLLWMCFRSSDICDFSLTTTVMETLQQDHTPQTCYATDKPFKSEAILHSASVEHHWISGSTKNAWCWLKDGSSCMQQDSCNTFIFATFCPECWTILAFGVAKMPKLSKLLPGPEWSWSCYTSEAISISITFSLDRSLCEKVSGSLIIYYMR